MPKPTARLSPSLQPRLGLWQVAQETLLERERRGSKNRVLPSTTFSGVAGFVFGCGTPSGRRKRSFHAAKSRWDAPTGVEAGPVNLVTAWASPQTKDGPGD